MPVIKIVNKYCAKLYLTNLNEIKKYSVVLIEIKSLIKFWLKSEHGTIAQA